MKNRVIKYFIVIFLCLYSGLQLQAQEEFVKPISAQAAKKLGFKSYRLGHVYEAIEYFEYYFEPFNNIKKSDAYYANILAGLYTNIKNYEKAKTWYGKVYKAAPKKYKKALWQYARMQKMTGDYEAAELNFKKFKKEFRKDKEYKEIRKELSNDIKGCTVAKTLIDSPLNVEIYNLRKPVNMLYSDISPVFTGDSSFLFSSIRSDEIIEISPDEDKPKTYFYSASKKNTSWKVDELEWIFNEGEENIFGGCFSADQKEFYFTKCPDGDVCHIYMSRMDGYWHDANPLPEPINIKGFSSMQPAYGIEPRKKYKVLYFVSDRPEGRGGYDIWYSIYDEKKDYYKDAKNAGGKINTPGNEVTPFYLLDESEFYFSSDGRPGLGGYDVFKTSGYLSKWEKPSNVGYPINSSYDDRYYVLNPANPAYGLLASNRKGGVRNENTCCDDLYRFKYKDFVRLGLAGQAYFVFGPDSLQSLENILSDKEDSTKKGWNLLTGAVIDLFLKDDEGNYMLIKSDTSGSEGKYFFSIKNNREYLIKASKEGYFAKQKQVSTLGRYLSDTLIRNLRLSVIPKKPIVVRNIYYPFDEYYLTDSARTIIDSTILRIMTENPEIIAEISSHTDSKGTDDYNNELSQKRAESVVNYLISKDISPDRLKAKGYGETIPIAPNKNPDGSDNPEGRQKNRRTEFRVIGLMPQYSEIIYSE